MGAPICELEDDETTTLALGIIILARLKRVDALWSTNYFSYTWLPKSSPVVTPVAPVGDTPFSKISFSINFLATAFLFEAAN